MIPEEVIINFSVRTASADNFSLLGARTQVAMVMSNSGTIYVNMKPAYEWQIFIYHYMMNSISQKNIS